MIARPPGASPAVLLFIRPLPRDFLRARIIVPNDFFSLRCRNFGLCYSGTAEHSYLRMM
jgi:hypothetical protein